MTRPSRACTPRHPQQGEAGFPFDESSLGTVAASEHHVSSYGGHALAEQDAPCRRIKDGREPSLADTLVGLDTRLSNRSVHVERRLPTAEAIDGGGGAIADGHVRDTPDATRAFR